MNVEINTERGLRDADRLTSSGSCGALLSTARKSKGLSVKDIASHLLLSVSHVEALESDNFASLPEATFTRGYIKSYAQLVDLDPEMVLSFYPATKQSEQDSSKMVIQPIEPLADHVTWSKFTISLIMVAVVILVIWYLQQTQVDQAVVLSRYPSQTNVLALADPTVTDDDSIVDAESNEAGFDQSLGEVAEGVAEMVDLAEAAAVTPGNLSENDLVMADRLTLNCQSAVWVDIRNSAGEKLFYRTCERDEVIGFVISLPALVFVGSIQGMELLLNDRVVDLSAESNGLSYARFTLRSWPEADAVPTAELESRVPIQ